MESDRQRYEHPLVHPLGELRRIHMASMLRIFESHPSQERQRIFHGFFGGGSFVDLEQLCNLIPDPIHRIQGQGWILEDNRNFLPPDAGQLSLGKPEKISFPIEDLPT